MNKQNEILKTEHAKQLKWLDKQISDAKSSLFLNPKVAMKEYEALGKDLIPDPLDVESFMNRYLTESAKKRLITTLKVAATRAKKGLAYQVNLEDKNKAKLEYLATKTGMKKADIINKLIEMADLEVITKKEEQLEITL